MKEQDTKGQEVIKLAKELETKLSALIAERGYRQDFIAKKIGLTEDMLSRYKHGLRIPPAVLASLATFFDVDPEELVGYVETRKVRAAV
jgi:transcriptional regulator with XRE-family HTH domain